MYIKTLQVSEDLITFLMVWNKNINQLFQPEVTQTGFHLLLKEMI